MEFKLTDTMTVSPYDNIDDISRREAELEATKNALVVNHDLSDELPDHLMDELEDDIYGPVPPGQEPYYIIQDPFARETSVLPVKIAGRY